MGGDEIQTGNPGGVSNRPVSRIADCYAQGDPYDRLLSGALLLPRRINVPAYLSCVWGVLAVALVLAGLFAQHYELRWVGSLCVYVSAAAWFGSLLGVPVFCLGIAGMHPKSLQGTGGFLCACAGVVLGVCALLGAVALFLEPMSHITGC
jgi:hypothetical protein